VLHGGESDLNGVPNYGGITGTKLLLNGSWLNLRNGLLLNGEHNGLPSSLQVIPWTSLFHGKRSSRQLLNKTVRRLLRKWLRNTLRNVILRFRMK